MNFYNLTETERDECISLIKSLDISELYKKENCNGDTQLIIILGNVITIMIEQERQYKYCWPHKTNTTGDIKIIIRRAGCEDIIYNYYDLLKIMEWHFVSRPFRLIVPSNLLSDETIKAFISLVIEINLPTKSTDTQQLIYYTEFSGINSILKQFPEIIKEEKPI